MIGMLGGEHPAERECSRAGCQRDAVSAIRWRNPKIHDEHRRKTWLACAEHIEYLRDFLEARSFPLEVISLDRLATNTPSDERQA